MTARILCGCIDYGTDFDHGIGFTVSLVGGSVNVMVVVMTTMVIMIMVMVVDSIAVAFGS